MTRRAGMLLRVAWCLVPLGMAFVPQDRFTLSVLAVAGAQALYVASWDLLAGISGQVSLGHALPFGGGAYAAAVVSGLGLLPPAAALIVGVLIGTALGALQGSLGARLHRISLALLTLAMAECAHALVGMLQISGPGGLLVGEEGGVPAIVFPAGEGAAARLAAAVLAVVLIGLLGGAHSRLGLATRTVRADARAAAASGIDVRRIRALAFVIAGGIAGLAGGLAASVAGQAVPSMLSLEPSLFALAVGALSGPGSIVGPAITAYAVSVAFQWVDLPETLRLMVYALVMIGAGLAGPGWAWLGDRLRTRPGGPHGA